MGMGKQERNLSFPFEMQITEFDVVVVVLFLRGPHWLHSGLTPGSVLTQGVIPAVRSLQSEHFMSSSIKLRLITQVLLTAAHNFLLNPLQFRAVGGSVWGL